MDGILNINKPAGITSHDVVDHIRKIFNKKKVGHTGTLDPAAEGVLPICIGKATKLSQYISTSTKTYAGIMRIGKRTDTQDFTGKTISQRPTDNISREDIIKAFSGYEGEIDQTPPMFSAVKFQGKRLYTLARKGICVERKPKKVHIYYITVKNFKDDLVSFEVKTSPGTYIRTLCDDVGEDLGCGALLQSLTRLQVGFFDIKNSITLLEAKEKVENGTITNVMYSMKKIQDTISFNPLQ